MCFTFNSNIIRVISGTAKPLNELFTQLTFTCSKLTIETLEQGVKYVQS